MKKFILTAVSLLIGGIILGVAVSTSGLKNILQIVHSLRWLWLLGVPVFFSVVFILDAWRWEIVLKYSGYRTTFGRLIVAKLAGFAICYITPIMYVGGEGAQGYILKKEANVPLVKGLSTIIVDKAVESLMVLIFFIICGCLMLWRLSNPIYVGLAGFLIAGSIVALLVFFWQIHRGRKFFVALLDWFHLDKIDFIARRKHRVEVLEDDIYNFFRTHKKALWKTLGISVLSTIAYILLFICVLQALNYQINLALIMILRGLAIFVSLIPVPAALGIYEGSFGFAFSGIGLDPSAGVAFSLIMRTLYILWSALGIAYISHFGIKLFYTSNDNGHQSESLSGPSSQKHV